MVFDWFVIIDCSFLMIWLQEVVEENFQCWIVSVGEFEKYLQELLCEVELVVVFVVIFCKEGMEDVDDEEYFGYVQVM